MYENSMSLLRMSDAEQREALARLFHIPQLTIAEKEIIDHAAEGKAEMEVKCLARSSSWASVTVKLNIQKRDGMMCVFMTVFVTVW